MHSQVNLLMKIVEEEDVVYVRVWRHKSRFTEFGIKLLINLVFYGVFPEIMIWTEMHDCVGQRIFSVYSGK